MTVQQAAGRAAILVAMLLGGAAPAAHAQGTTPFLIVTRSPATTVTSIVVGAPVAPARIALDVPKGYTIGTGGRPAGSPIGSVVILLGDPASSTTPLQTGQLTVADPSRFAADATAMACDAGTHIATWEIDLKDGTATTALPVFVDAATPEDPADAGYRLQVCPSPAAQPGFTLVLSLSVGVLVEPAAPDAYLWHGFVTPAPAAGAAPDPAQTYEIRAVVPLPQSYTLRGVLTARTHQAVITGEILEQGQPIAGVSVRVSATSRHPAARPQTVTTDEHGKFQLTWSISETTVFTATPLSGSLGPCSAGSSAPAGCRSETFSLPGAQRTTVTVPLATDAKRALRAADNAAAAGVNLKLTDFPAGWSSRAVDPEKFAVCPDFHPDESGLAVTGVSTSPVFQTGDVLGSPSQAAVARVTIWRTAIQAARAFAREAARGQIQCIVDDHGGFTVVASGALHMHGASRVRGFRVVLKDPGGAGTFYLDVVSVLGKRSLVTLIFDSVNAPSSTEQSVIARLAARAGRV